MLENTPKKNKKIYSLSEKGRLAISLSAKSRIGFKDKKTGRFTQIGEKPFDKKEYFKQYHLTHYKSKGGYQKGAKHHLWKGGDFDLCPTCNNKKWKKTNHCRKCFGLYLRGELHPKWKGGYENTKKLLKIRELKIKENGGHHSEKQWEDLKTKFGNICLCCKRSEPEIKLQRDHIIPISKGGHSNIDNIQPLCQSCNSIKHTKIIDFISLMPINC